MEWPSASSQKPSLSRSQLSLVTVPVEVEEKVTVWPVSGAAGL